MPQNFMLKKFIEQVKFSEHKQVHTVRLRVNGYEKKCGETTCLEYGIKAITSAKSTLPIRIESDPHDKKAVYAEARRIAREINKDPLIRVMLSPQVRVCKI